MKIYSLSHLSQKEFDELLDRCIQRRKFFWLLSLTIILAPITLGFALYCSDRISFLRTGWRKSSPYGVCILHIIGGIFIPIIVVLLLNLIPFFGKIVLGAKIVH